MHHTHSHFFYMCIYKKQICPFFSSLHAFRFFFFKRWPIIQSIASRIFFGIFLCVFFNLLRMFMVVVCWWLRYCSSIINSCWCCRCCRCCHIHYVVHGHAHNLLTTILQFQLAHSNHGRSTFFITFIKISLFRRNIIELQPTYRFFY